MEELTLLEAAEILRIGADTSRRNTNITCPCCGSGRQKKLNLNFEKNVFRCNKCGIYGGPLHLWALYRGLSADDLKAVARDYYQFMGSNEPLKEKIAKPKNQFYSSEIKIAPLEVRNRTYSTLLEQLSLSDTHLDNLLKRGLDEDAVRKNQYKSYPQIGLTNITDLLIEQGCIVEGVPGFYKNKSGKWCLRHLSPGILIPQRDGFGRIQGFQIRLDKSKDCKYITLSTADFECGAKGAAHAHFRKGSKGLRTVILTEGPLKGDVISHFTDYSVLAVQGVNTTTSLKDVIEDLKEAGMDELMIAFDMDYKKNPYVKKALGNLKRILTDCEVMFSTLDWDDNCKGLDDYLLCNMKQKKR